MRKSIVESNMRTNQLPYRAYTQRKKDPKRKGQKKLCDLSESSR